MPEHTGRKANYQTRLLALKVKLGWSSVPPLSKGLGLGSEGGGGAEPIRTSNLLPHIGAECVYLLVFQYIPSHR